MIIYYWSWFNLKASPLLTLSDNHYLTSSRFSSLPPRKKVRVYHFLNDVWASVDDPRLCKEEGLEWPTTLELIPSSHALPHLFYKVLKFPLFSSPR